MSIAFDRGSTLRLTQGNTMDAKLVLSGNTRITAHAPVKVDPRTGTPTLDGNVGLDLTIEGESIDLKQVLEPMGAAVTHRIGSRTTARIRGAKVEVLERGFRIHHEGISVEIAAGVIEFGR